MTRAARATEPARPSEFEDSFGRDGLAYHRHLALGALFAVLVLVVVAGGLAWGQYKDSKRTALGGERARAVLAGRVVETYFRGQLSTLRSIAGAPSVVARDLPVMQRYVDRLQDRRAPTFSGGVAWIDRSGIARVSTVHRAAAQHVNLSDRSYSRHVIATGAPYVSESINSRLTHRNVVVMATPTRDHKGRLTGMLVGALRLQPFAMTRDSLDLGGADLSILDRNGRSILDGSRMPRNAGLARSLDGAGTRADTRGLDGSPHHAVAFSASGVAGWTVVIDQPRSRLFGAARRAFLLELALVAAAASFVLFLIAVTLLRGRRDAARERTRAQQRRALLRTVGDASLGSEVSDGLVAGLSGSFPGALCIVALEDEHHLHLELSGSAEVRSPRPRTRAR